MKSIAMLMIFIFAGLTASGVQAEIYSWIDETGTKHYSQTPPPDRSVLIKTSPEIQPESTTDQEIEKLNEENVDADEPSGNLRNIEVVENDRNDGDRSVRKGVGAVGRRRFLRRVPAE